jgi:hypothetical protein
MGITCGFDITVPITSAEDIAACKRLIDDVRRKYAPDPNVHFQADGFFTIQGEVPRMPYDGTLFGRFDSKITGHYAHEVDRYMMDVQAIFERHFGADHVERWREGIEGPSRGFGRAAQGWMEPLDKAGRRKYDVWAERTQIKFEIEEEIRRQREEDEWY